MLLVDTSVWVDHLRRGDDALVSALEHDAVVMHPHVAGELALGNLKDRFAVLALLRNLPQVVVATDDEVQTMIEELSLFGRGIGYTDAHLFGRNAANNRGTAVDPRQASESRCWRPWDRSASLMSADLDLLMLHR